MEELLNIAFSPVNALLSILLILMMLYWLLTILTGIDLDVFDIDFDVDADIDMNPDIDADVDSKIDFELNEKEISLDKGGDGFFIQFLKYFGFDELPFMFLLSVVIFSMWFLSINLNHYLDIESNLIGFILLIPILFFSLFIAKILTKPLVKVYRLVNHPGEEAIDFLGREGRILSAISEEKLGQVEIIIKGDPIKIYVKSFNGIKIDSGEIVEVINESKTKKYFIIRKIKPQIK
jgi:hypothetical protein